MSHPTVWYNPARNKSNAASLPYNPVDQTVRCPTQRFGITQPEIGVMQQACAITFSSNCKVSHPTVWYNPARTIFFILLQFDWKGNRARLLHYSYFWLGYTKPLGGTPYSLIENVIAQAGRITPSSGRVIPNRWVGHLTVWSTRLYGKLAALLLFLAGLY